MNPQDTMNMIPASDRGLQYGDGLFETMRIWQGTIPLLPHHLARLTSGLARLAFPVLEHSVLEDAVVGALARTPGREGVLKLTVTRGDGGRGYAPPEPARPRILVALHSLPRWREGLPWVGARCGRCRTLLGRNPATAGLKHLSRIEQVLGAAEVAAAGWDEGFMCDEAGQVIEGTRANVFALIGDTLVTPGLDRAGVAGVLRDRVMAWAGRVGMDLEVRSLSYDALMMADEIFLSSSVFGLWPVAELGAGRWSGFARCRQVAEGLAGEDVPWLA